MRYYIYVKSDDYLDDLKAIIDGDTSENDVTLESEDDSIPRYLNQNRYF